MITKIGQPASETGRFRTLSFCFGFLSGDRKKKKKNPLLVEEGLGLLAKRTVLVLAGHEGSSGKEETLRGLPDPGALAGDRCSSPHRCSEPPVAAASAP